MGKEACDRDAKDSHAEKMGEQINGAEWKWRDYQGS